MNENNPTPNLPEEKKPNTSAQAYFKGFKVGFTRAYELGFESGFKMGVEKAQKMEPPTNDPFLDFLKSKPKPPKIPKIKILKWKYRGKVELLEELMGLPKTPKKELINMKLKQLKELYNALMRLYDQEFRHK